MALKSSRLGAIFLVLLFLAAVGSVVWRNWGRNVGDLVIDQKPAESVFVGRWQLQGTSLASVTARTGKPAVRAELTLSSNGRFSATELPIEDGFRDPKWRLMSGEGYWELYHHQYWTLSLGFMDGFGVGLDIRAKNGSVVALTHSVGDPDSSELWIWTRVSE